MLFMDKLKVDGDFNVPQTSRNLITSVEISAFFDKIQLSLKEYTLSEKSMEVHKIHSKQFSNEMREATSVVDVLEILQWARLW